MNTTNQTVKNYTQTGKITRNVALKILERLNSSNQISPKGREYTFDMVRNWLYNKTIDPKIEVMYLSVISEIDPRKTEKRQQAMMHLEIAEKLLAEI